MKMKITTLFFAFLVSCLILAEEKPGKAKPLEFAANQTSGQATWVIKQKNENSVFEFLFLDEEGVAVQKINCPLSQRDCKEGIMQLVGDSLYVLAGNGRTLFALGLDDGSLEEMALVGEKPEAAVATGQFLPAPGGLIDVLTVNKGEWAYDVWIRHSSSDQDQHLAVKGTDFQGWNYNLSEANTPASRMNRTHLLELNESTILMANSGEPFLRLISRETLSTTTIPLPKIMTDSPNPISEDGTWVLKAMRKGQPDRDLGSHTTHGEYWHGIAVHQGEIFLAENSSSEPGHTTIFQLGADGTLLQTGTTTQAIYGTFKISNEKEISSLTLSPEPMMTSTEIELGSGD